MQTDTMPLRCVAVCVKVCSSVCDVIHCMLRALHGWAQGAKRGNTTNRACKRCVRCIAQSVHPHVFALGHGQNTEA